MDLNSASVIQSFLNLFILLGLIIKVKESLWQLASIFVAEKFRWPKGEPSAKQFSYSNPAFQFFIH